MRLDEEGLRHIRELTLIALFTDDDLVDTLVLKGGNALDIGYGLSSRASIDLDLSMRKEFEDIGLTNIEEIETRIQQVLKRSFQPEGLVVFDVKVKEKPKIITVDESSFWGGYEATFKIIEWDKYEKWKENSAALGAKAIATNKDKKNVKIDFGRFEYCESTINKEIDGFEISLYTPELMVFEKLRAICQQMPEYLESIGKSQSFGKPRPRDFYDIYTLINNHLVLSEPVIKSPI